MSASGPSGPLVFLCAVGCSRRLYACAHVMDYFLRVYWTVADPDQTDHRGIL